MATFTDLVNDIKADLTLNGSDYDAAIIRKGQTALRRLRGKRYWFLRGNATLTAAVSSETITISAQVNNFSVIDSLDLIADGTRYYNFEGFDRLSYDELRSVYWDQGTIPTGRPVAWAIESGVIYLSHKADQAYSLLMNYYKQDATLPGAGGVTIWGDDGYEVLRAMTMNIFKRDTQGMTVTESDREMLAEELEALGMTHISKTEGEF